MLPELEKHFSALKNSTSTTIEMKTLKNWYALVKFSQWEDVELETATQIMIDLLDESLEKEKLEQLGLNIVEALIRENELNNLSFEALITKLNNTNKINFITIVLRCLAATYNKKYFYVVEKYLNNPEVMIQEQAKETISHLKY